MWRQILIAGKKNLLGNKGISIPLSRSDRHESINETDKEEVDDDTIYYSEYYCEAPERSFVVAEAPQQQSDSCNEYESVYESVGSFTV